MPWEAIVSLGLVTLWFALLSWVLKWTRDNSSYHLAVWQLRLPVVFVPTVGLWALMAAGITSVWPKVSAACFFALVLILLFFVGWHIYLICAGNRKSQLFGYLVLNIIIFLILHPLLVGLPGRIGETVLQVALHRGLARPRAEVLARVTLGSSSGVDSEYSAPTQDANGDLEVWYGDWGTFCFESGKHYVLHFDKDGRLQSWGVEDWTDGC